MTPDPTREKCGNCCGAGYFGQNTDCRQCGGTGFTTPAQPVPAAQGEEHPETRRYRLALESLTVGGSEFYKNPDYCVQHIREMRAGDQNRWIKAALANKEKDAALAAAREEIARTEKENASQHDQIEEQGKQIAALRAALDLWKKHHEAWHLECGASEWIKSETAAALSAQPTGEGE